MNMDLFFDHYFKFLRTKTEIYKSNFNLINLDGFEALKRQIPGMLLGIWQNYIEIMWFKEHFHRFWSYTLIFQYYGVFVKFPWFPSFIFGYRAHKENLEITENLFFLIYKVQMHVDLFFHWSLFQLSEH